MLIERLVEPGTDKPAPEDADIFRSLYPRLRGFAAVVGPDEVEPDDLVQEAVERVLRQHNLSQLDNPYAYLCRVMVNLASNHRRSLARARRATRRLVTDEAAGQPYPSDLADLLRVPPKQRAMLYLREIEGLSFAEIGEWVGMDGGAVARSIQRARKRLGAEMREELS